MTTTTWHDDVLGEGWRARTIPLGSDNEGPLEATLVRSPGAPAHSRAVLYIHGFVDYFFQTEMAAAFTEAGYDFYAIDLRKYGRSLRAGQSPNDTNNLADYATELDEAAHIIRTEDAHTHLTVVGHSTGGLIGALWANARPKTVDALVLNSPWLDLNRSWFLRTIGTRAIATLAMVAPRTVVGTLDRFYGQALHSGTGGEWDFDLAWKPHEGFPMRAAWLTSIRRSQARVARGLSIPCPVLVCASDASGDFGSAHERLLTTDSVLDVEQIVARAPGLGPDVTIRQIPGGAHDLALSPEPARSTYMATVLEWLAPRSSTH